MKIVDMQRPLLTEAIQTRISHPEDLVWQQGSSGVNSVFNGLNHLANNTGHISIKFDGSPALIFGRDPFDGMLVVTDKSGFNAKRYDGFPKSARLLKKMLYNRNPLQLGRQNYASQIASLWPLFESIVPADFVGFLQCDLMYIGTPEIVDDHFHIKPNKILYTIPVSSELGQQIDNSLAGIVVHGYIADRNASVVPAVDITLNDDNRVVIFSPNVTTIPHINVDAPTMPNIALIDQLLDTNTLKSLKISDFAGQIGKYVANMARHGNNSYANAANEFISWLDTTANVSQSKRENIKLHINNNAAAYDEIWNAIANISELKTKIKKQFDTTSNHSIKAYLGNNIGHEGYVITTPAGVIKLVDRHEFMRE